MLRLTFLVLVLCLQSASLVLAQAQDSYIPGKFVQADLLTNDLQAVMPFYSGLFGWTFQEHPGYTVVFAGDPDMGTIFERDITPDATRKPRWIAYMSVPDVGGAANRDQQRWRYCWHRASYPIWARWAFSPIRKARCSALSTGTAAIRKITWRTPVNGSGYILSRDAARAGDFYAQLAPYELVDNPLSERSGSYLLVSQEYARAGLVTIPADRTDVQPAWLPFVRVESIAAATARVQQLGGKVLVAPRPDLADGKVAVLADPTGAAIGILEWQYAAAPREQLR